MILLPSLFSQTRVGNLLTAECATYFNPSGISTRIMLQDILQKDNLRDKFRFTAMLYNYSCIGDDYLLMEGIYKPEDLKITEDAILTARFAAGDGAKDFITETDTKYTFPSFDGHCKVHLLKACPFLFEVEFSRLIPSKEPVLIKKPSKPDHSLLADPPRMKTSDLYDNNSLLSQSIRSAYPRATGTAGLGAGKLGYSLNNNTEVGLGHQYFVQCQKFNVGDFPIKYSYPLFVLLDHRFGKESSPVVRDIVRDLFSSKFLEIMDGLARTGELPSADEVYLRNEYGVSYLKGYLLVQINKFKDAEAQLEAKTQEKHPRVAGLLQKSAMQSNRGTYNKPGQGTGSLASRKEGNSAQDRIDSSAVLDWGEDSRNPTSDISLVENYTRYLMLPNYEVFFSGGSCLVYSIPTGMYMVTSAESPDFLKLEDVRGESRLINMNMPQKVLRTVIRGEIVEEIEVGKIVEVCFRILKCNRINQFMWKNAAAKRLKATEREKSRFSSSTGLTSGPGSKHDDPETAFNLVKCCTSPRAVCEAYQNRSVKLKFIDRTILTIDLNRPRVFQVISKYGEILELGVNKPGAFAEYLEEAQEFSDFVFTDPSEREARESAKKHHQALVDEALRSNQALKKLLKPQDPGVAEEEPRKDRILHPIQAVTSTYSVPIDHSRELGSIDLISNSDRLHDGDRSDLEFMSASWRRPENIKPTRHEFTPTK